ncbi:MAG: hypothetical protein PHS49_05010 [Candidatus Gracilibacteria bacterium]|nr:hypothetical protein [Candidatus Gracilibacteria bacterium]
MRIKKTFIEVILTLLVITGTSFTFALLNDLKVNSNDPLTSTLWNGLVDHSVPSGAVMAFDLQACPTGWTEYTALQGKFIRGADTGAVNDPDFASRTGGTGARKIGSTQNDDFKSHNHYSPTRDGGAGTHEVGDSNSGVDFPPYETTSNTGGNETRPKNVYLLYCKKD